jgi:hypothetical protein
MRFRNRLACLLSVLVTVTMTGCGTNQDTQQDTQQNTQQNTPASSAASTTDGSVSGFAVNSDTGLPLANVKVAVAGRTVVTGTDGSFKLDGVAPSNRVVLRFTLEGYADGFAATPVSAAGTGGVTARLSQIAASKTFTNSAGATVSDSASSASVILAPASLVNEATGAAPLGAITATIAIIDPAANPANMPGDYTTTAGNTIESFGALAVQLQDSTGSRLNLASGQTSTIRIPLRSRSATPPPTIPLYYFNEATGLWVEEGTATLAGAAPSQYYEGTVRHFTVWNADVSMQTVFVNGCLIDPQGRPLSTFAVMSEGVDYSGSSYAAPDSTGKFKLVIRRNAVAKIAPSGFVGSSVMLAGPSAADISLPACLTIQRAAGPVMPAFLSEPHALSAEVGSPATFYVAASGSDLKYQWLRDGQTITGATGSFYTLAHVSSADNNAQFSVRVTNLAGSVTSGGAPLTVLPSKSADIFNLLRLTFLAVELNELGIAPVTYFTNSNIDTWHSPAAACTSGSATGTLNSGAIPVNTPVLAGSGTIVGTFNNCVNNAIDQDAVLSGTATIAYTTDAKFRNGSASVQLTNMRRIYTDTSGGGLDTDVTGNGVITTAGTTTESNGVTTTDGTIIPGANSSLRSNKTGQAMSFVSGSIRLTTVESLASAQSQSTIAQNALTYVFNGDTYVSSGTISITSGTGISGGSGQIVLTKNGVQIGRIYATAQGVFYETNGTLQPFGQAATILSKHAALRVRGS